MEKFVVMKIHHMELEGQALHCKETLKEIQYLFSQFSDYPCILHNIGAASEPFKHATVEYNYMLSKYFDFNYRN